MLIVKKLFISFLGNFRSGFFIVPPIQGTHPLGWFAGMAYAHPLTHPLLLCRP